MNKGLSIRSQQGSTGIVLAMVLAGAVTAGVYTQMDAIIAMSKEISGRSAMDRTQQANISGLSEVIALMTYQPDPNNGTVSSTYASGLPYVYPEPYIGNLSVDRTRAAPSPAPTTWSVSSVRRNGTAVGMVSTSFSDARGLNARDFATFADNRTKRPTFNNRSEIVFNRALYDATFPYWIRGYNVSVAGRDRLGVTTTAEIGVPPMPVPRCKLVPVGAKTLYQPNEKVTLNMYVSGVALEAYVPNDVTAQMIAQRNGNTIQRLVAPIVDNRPVPAVGTYSRKSLLTTARSVRGIDQFAFQVVVTSPRPLVAVDGSGEVTFTVDAAVRPADNNSVGAESTCFAELKVVAPSSCRLYTAQSSVPAGGCTDITATVTNGADLGSLTMTAADISGRDYSGNIGSRSVSTRRFCTPTDSFNGSDAARIPADLKTTYNQATKGLKADQLGALNNAFNTHVNKLKSIFRRSEDSALWALTIDECTALFFLTPAERENIGSIDLRSIKGLENLTSAETERLKAMSPSQLDARLNALADDVDLSNTDALRGVPNIEAMNKFDPSTYSTFLDSALEALNKPTIYTLTGRVKDRYGGSVECVTRVTRGVNQCPFFGNRYPNYTQSANLFVQHSGGSGYHPITMHTGYPNWEITSVASSPYAPSDCPSGSRCFAVDGYGNRMPMAQISNADSPNCKLSFFDRINLGCFEYHTKIRMADGSDKEIAAIEIGDQVLNPVLGKPARVKRTTKGPEVYPLVVVQVGGDTVRVTRQHPMLTAKGLKAAWYLAVGDQIRDLNGKWRRVDKISHEVTRNPVVNIEIEGASSDPSDHALLADGVITGDLYLQERLGENLTVGH